MPGGGPGAKPRAFWSVPAVGRVSAPVRAALLTACGALAVTVAIGIYFIAVRGWSILPLGLLGALIITDPNDKADPHSDIDYAMVLNDGPLGFTLNGKGFPATEPIVAKLGQTVRVRYMNEGLQIHPMHLHGLPQLVIAKDGFLLPDPHYEDTVLVAPGERVDVLINATELGTWAFHCHILTHVESDHGMFGMVTALIVQQ